MGEVRIKGNHFHFQAKRAAGHNRTDVARANQPQRFARNFRAHKAGFFPLASLGRGIRRRNLPRHGKHHRNRVLGGGDRVAKRRVHHHNPFGRSRREVHVVHANTGATNNFEVISFGNQFRRGFGGRADRKAIIITDDLGQLGRVFTKVGLEVHFHAVVFEDLHRCGAEFVRNKNFGHITCSCI